MPNQFLPKTFTTFEDTRFKNEFTAYLAARNAWWNLLSTLPTNNERIFEITLICAIGPTSAGAKTVVTASRINVTEKAIAYYAMKLAAATGESAETLITEIRASTNMTANALDMLRGDVEFAKSLLSVATFPLTASERNQNGINQNTGRAACARARAAMITARNIFINAIKSDFGNNIQFVAMPTENITRRNVLGADDLKLNLPIPIAITNDATVDGLTADLAGAINPKHIDTNANFAWGKTLDFGNLIPAIPVYVGNGSVAIPFSQNLDGLEANTLYYYRLRVISKWLGLFVGGIRTFTTQGLIPVATNTDIFQNNQCDDSGILFTVYYDQNISFGNNTVLYADEPLNAIFDGNNQFYTKVGNEGNPNYSFQVSPSGVVYGYSQCN